MIDTYMLSFTLIWQPYQENVLIQISGAYVNHSATEYDRLSQILILIHAKSCSNLA